MLLTAASYFLAYVRDAGVAALFGAGTATDAFFAGTFPPMLIYYVALAGALVPSVIPVLAARKMSSQGESQAAILAPLGRWVTGLALVVVLLGELGAPVLIAAIAPGFGAQEAAQAVLYLRLSLPMLAFLTPATLLAAVLNYQHNFLAPALGSLVFSGTLVASLIPAQRYGIQVMAVAMAFAGLAQLLVLLAALRPDIRAAVLSRGSGDRSITWQVGKLAGPILLFGLVTQGLTLLERLFASGLVGGALSQLAYANKLSSMPVTVIAASVATVLLPSLARGAAKESFEDTALLLRQSVRRLVVLVAPVSALFVVGSGEIVALLLTRGNFARNASVETGGLLAIYALGMLPAALGIVLGRALYARHRTRPPLVAALLGFAAYVSLALLLRGHYGAVGLAFAMSGAAFASTSVLLGYLHYERILNLREAARDNIPPVAAALLSGIVAWLVNIEEVQLGLPAYVRAALLALVVGASYLAAGVAMGAFSVRTLTAGRVMLRKRGTREVNHVI